MRVFCVHCRHVNAAQGGSIICAGCGRRLAVRRHVSPRLHAVMGVQAEDTLAPPLMKPADGVFRGALNFRNSPAAIARFPFPFGKDEFAYKVNLQRHAPDGVHEVFDAAFDIDEHYEDEMDERAMTLAADPLRCQVLPHMAAAQWETLALLMSSLARDFPEKFELHRDGDAWRWVNHARGIAQSFTYNDAATLPCPAFEYITRQVQGDFTLLDQRDDNLYLDGGMLTSPADWSLQFNLGMSFAELHAPVTRIAHETGMFESALTYLKRLKTTHPMRRLNWSLTVNPWLDTAPETYPVWGPDRAGLSADMIGAKLCLRVELQTLHRLPQSRAILFGIRAYLVRLEELVLVPGWAQRLHRVIRGLHPEIAAYKGFAGYRTWLIDYLAPFDAGCVN